MDWTSLMQSVIANFPVFAAAMAGWVIAEQRARRWERRYVAMARECAGLPDEDVTNGSDL